jgi:electron transport complex protein RnfG
MTNSGDLTSLRGAEPSISAMRLLGTLGIAGALAGLLIVVVYQATLPTVQANRAARLESAIFQVLPGSTRFDTLYFVGDKLTAQLPAGIDSRALERVFAGFDDEGRRVGFAIAMSEPGFQDAIEIIFGFDPAQAATLGLVILGSRETPGLGDKIEAASWLGQFRGLAAPLVPVKAGRSGKPREVDMITGATISSRSVISAINKGIARWSPRLSAYTEGGGS